MAITKQGNAFLAMPLHILQNKAMQKLLDTKLYHKAVWQHLYNGATGNTLLSKDTARLIHGVGPAIPEMQILANEAYHSGKSLKPLLAPIGQSAPNLQALAKLRRAASGNYDAMTRRPLKPLEVDAMTALYSALTPGADAKTVRELLTNFTPEKAQKLKQLMAGNPLTGKLLRGVADHSKLPSPTAASNNTITMEKAKSLYGTPANIITNGALAVADPFTAGVNISKQIVFSHDLADKFKPIKRVQDMANEYLIKKPAVNAYHKASTGEPGLFKKLYDKYINPDVINPLNAYATQFAEGLGKIVKS